MVCLKDLPLTRAVSLLDVLVVGRGGRVRGGIRLLGFCCLVVCGCIVLCRRFGFVVFVFVVVLGCVWLYFAGWGASRRAIPALTLMR